VSFFGEGGHGPHLTQSRLDHVASQSIQPFGHNGHGPKIGGCATLGEAELGPHLTQCRLVEAYLPTNWHLDPSSHFATMDMGRKLVGCVPLGRGAGSPSNTMRPGPRHTFTPSFILIHPTVWPQYTNVINTTDRQNRTGQDGPIA